MRISVLIVGLALIFSACSSPAPRPETQTYWQGDIHLTGDVKLPISFTTTGKDPHYQIEMQNGNERIVWQAAQKEGETFVALLEPYNSELRFTFTGNEIQGVWIMPDKGPDYLLAFKASNSNAAPRGDKLKALSGTWEVQFLEETGETFPAVGEFRFSGDTLLGTFRTETGDYRYLWGKAEGNSFQIGTFDGAHAFLFTGMLKADSITQGHFYSGSHYHATWKAVKNQANKLRDPFSISYFEHASEGILIQLPPASGDQLILGTPNNPGPVYVLEIMGTWCPNCKDAAIYLQSLNERFEPLGLRIAGFCFERGDEEAARLKVRNYRSRLQISYPLYYAGTLATDEVYKVFPTLRDFISYPTLILVDKYGKVRGVHAGFNGPATSSYQGFVSHTDSIVEALLKE
jgi:thiol-disulfide isomerase/thioredoxin